MGKKKRNATEDEEQLKSQTDRRIVVLGIAVLVVAVIAGSVIGTIFIVGVRDDASALELPAFTGGIPAIERSSAADLLESKSFDEMTADERAEVRAETIRVYSNAEFRVENPVYLGVDIFRRGGKTLAARQYGVSDAPGGQSLTETISFFCDNDDGSTARYRAVRSLADTQTAVDVIEEGQRAMERIIDDLDWSEVTDLGKRKIHGRQARGVELRYRFSDTVMFRTQAWFDIENARVLKYVQYDEQDVPSPFSNYEFDWRVPPRFEPAPGQQVPCYDQIFS